MRTIRLCIGMGTEGESHCVMAATSIVAEEPFSDNPSCVCPTIRAALININDRCPSNEIRERLLGHLPWMIIGTRGSSESQLLRAKKFAAYAARAADAACANAADAAARAAAACAGASTAARAAAACANATSTAASTAARAAAACANATSTAAACANAADAAAYANAADAAAVATDAIWEKEVKKFIDFIEQEIIPVHTTMTIEPEYNLEKLCVKTS